MFCEYVKSFFYLMYLLCVVGVAVCISVYASGKDVGAGFSGLFWAIRAVRFSRAFLHYRVCAHLRCFDVMVRWWFNVSKERFNIYCA